MLSWDKQNVVHSLHEQYCKEVREKYSLLNECERLVIANFIADQIGRDRENYDLDDAGLQNAIDLWHMKEDGIL